MSLGVEEITQQFPFSLNATTSENINQDYCEKRNQKEYGLINFQGNTI